MTDWDQEKTGTVRRWVDDRGFGFIRPDKKGCADQSSKSGEQWHLFLSNLPDRDVRFSFSSHFSRFRVILERLELKIEGTYFWNKITFFHIQRLMCSSISETVKMKTEGSRRATK